METVIIYGDDKHKNHQASVTSGSTGPVTLQGHTLLVVFDPQHAALLWARRLWGASGQDHPDLPAVHVQVSALPHVDVLRFQRLRNQDPQTKCKTELRSRKDTSLLDKGNGYFTSQ